MSINRSEIEKVAHLARLALPEQELTQYTHELSNILDLIAQMQQVDTKHVVPMAHPLDLSQPLRPDVVTEHDQRELLLRIAPLTESGLYLVPQVIE
ncbi:MAG: Asp-tRNA(Asn)/Glu-tRNA(Gln) amidotransferase subunit GatC [Coxiellaceae bacterium]|nr:MAG: Asp-tRNA(Asn)/Glu-tRNA(Gln) amidotransferase subunit GatC [Coxiellaceae bacterium]